MSPPADRKLLSDPGASFRSRLGPLFLLTALFYLNFVSRVITAPLIPAIERELGFGHGEAGSLFLLISAGYFFSLIASGFISARYTHRKTISMSSVVLGITLLVIARCDTFWGLSAGMIAIGLATGVYLPSAMATLTSLVDHRDWGKAIGVHELAPNLSFLTAPLIAEALFHWVSWRGVLSFVGVWAFVLGLVYAKAGRGGGFCGEAPQLRSLKALVCERNFWIMLLLFGLGIGGTIGIYTMLPLFLVTEKGLENNWANMLVALSRAFSPAAVFLAGWITDRIGLRAMFVGVFILSGLSVILIGMTDGLWLVAFVLIQPVMASCFFPAGFASLSLAVPQRVRSIAVSFTIPFAYVIGAGIMPTLIGIAGDLDLFAAGFVAVGLFTFSGAFLARFLVFAKG